MNTFNESTKGRHFTLSDRIAIEAGIEKGLSFKKIASELGKSPSSVSREVRYKKRKKKNLDAPIPGYRQNRTFRDLHAFLSSNPDTSIVELDVVEGSGGKSAPVLLTLFFRSCSLMLLFLMPADRREYVQDIFDFLLAELGPQTYSHLFQVILTDNGSSFLDPSVFEMPHRQDIHTKLFYCDPMASWQKGRLEKNHEFIRYILPKGTSFELLTEQNVNLMMNHINSTARASLNGCTPFQLALLLLDAKLMEIMNLKPVPADKIHLKPSLIK